MNRLLRKIDHFLHPIQGEIWMLHRVTTIGTQIPAMQPYEITPGRLAELLTDYQQRGYHFVSIDQLYQMHRAHRYPLRPFVCVTLDDGYLDNLTEALPVFKRFDCPFCIYMSTAFTDGRTRSWWYEDEDVPFLSVDQLRQLASEPLCTIGAHTVTHPFLTRLSSEEKRSEIMNAKLQLEEILQSPVHHFAYPHGDYDDECVALVRQTGFHTATAAWGGGVRSNNDLFTLPRIRKS